MPTFRPDTCEIPVKVPTLFPGQFLREGDPQRRVVSQSSSEFPLDEGGQHTILLWDREGSMERVIKADSITRQPNSKLEDVRPCNNCKV